MTPAAIITRYCRLFDVTPKQLAREVGVAYSTLMYIMRGQYDSAARVKVEGYCLNKLNGIKND